jgi:hypothetical protein
MLIAGIVEGCVALFAAVIIIGYNSNNNYEHVKFDYSQQAQGQ